MFFTQPYKFLWLSLNDTNRQQNSTSRIVDDNNISAKYQTLLPAVWPGKGLGNEAANLLQRQPDTNHMQ